MLVPDLADNNPLSVWLTLFHLISQLGLKQTFGYGFGAVYAH